LLPGGNRAAQVKGFAHGPPKQDGGFYRGKDLGSYMFYQIISWKREKQSLCPKGILMTEANVEGMY
jgi:hypothetical protein